MNISKTYNFPKVYFDFRDLVIGFKSLVGYRSESFDKIENFFGTKDIFFTDSGRDSLFVILKSLNLSKNSKIGVPLYCCEAVFRSITNAGFKPLFIDIDSSNYSICLNDLTEKKEEIDALLLVHTFGIPAQINEIKSILNHKIPIIEDCAHSIFSKYYNKPLGTFGDVSFFTFSSGKYFFCGGGSIIICNNKKVTKKLRKNIVSILPQNKYSELVALLNSYRKGLTNNNFSFTKKIYNRIVTKSINPNKRSSGLASISNYSKCLILNNFESFKKCAGIQRIRSIKMIEDLESNRICVDIEREGVENNYFLLPLRFENVIDKRRAKLIFFQNNIIPFEIWSEAPLIARKYGYQEDCKVANIIARTTLAVQIHHRFNNNDIANIKNAIKQISIK